MKTSSAVKLDNLWKIFAPIFIVLLSLDQLSKEWAESSLRLGERVDFGFSLSHNDGIVFGLDLPMPAIYIIIAGILGLGTFLVIKNKLWINSWYLAGFALILAGAIGNLIDRIRFGYVVDFIQIYWWPTFNLADTWIVCAVIFFLVDAAFFSKETEGL